jgi:hypothetical protein
MYMLLEHVEDGIREAIVALEWIVLEGCVYHFI